MEVVSKFVDAASMFWQSLTEEERRIVMYLGAYFACSVVFALHKANDERRRARLLAELREELTRAG